MATAPLALVAITDLARCADDALAARIAAMAAAVPVGALAVQLRAKHLTGAALFAVAAALRAQTRGLGVPLWINDRLDVARAIDADGIHLPEAGLDLATARALAGGRALGASRHRADDLPAADLIQLGPIWTTPSKLGYGPPLGVAALTRARAATAATVVAVGGVDGPAQAEAAATAGADAVAAIRALWDADDPGAIAAALVAAVERGRGRRK